MKIAAFINGSLISENSCIYALFYAKRMKAKVLAFFVKEKKFDEESVKESFNLLNKLAKKLDVEMKLLVLKSFSDISSSVKKHKIELIFTSTKAYHSVFESSFSKSLLNEDLKCDIAIVKILKLGIAKGVEKIILPIREDRVSVKKFVFFATLSSSYNAHTQIYCVDKVTKRELADDDKKNRKIKNILFNLKHYIYLSKLINLDLTVKHTYATIEEANIVNTHIARKNFDLVIVGGDRKSFFRKHPIDILFEKPITNTIYFVPWREII
jgi:hypothetical protein